MPHFRLHLLAVHPTRFAVYLQDPVRHLLPRTVEFRDDDGRVLLTLAEGTDLRLPYFVQLQHPVERVHAVVAQAGELATLRLPPALPGPAASWTRRPAAIPAPAPARPASPASPVLRS